MRRGSFAFGSGGHIPGNCLFAEVNCLFFGVLFWGCYCINLKLYEEI